MVLGCSTNTTEQAVAAEKEGADYVGVGSVYPTSSKEKAIVVTIDRIIEVKKSVSIPVVAIGGIDKTNAAEVLASGADSVAVISAILDSEQPEKATRQIVDAIEVVKCPE
jgi:thiamine-phosphate diphosphorylase